MNLIKNFRISKKALLILSAVFLFTAFNLSMYASAYIEAVEYPFQYGTHKTQSAPEITECSKSIKSCILWAFSGIFSVLIWLAGALGVIMFVWAGILYITKPQEAAKIHSRLYWGVIGIIVSLASFGIVKFIEFNLTRGIGALYTPASQIAFAAESVNPLERFLKTQESVRPAGISGCENANSIFSYLNNKKGVSAIPSGLLGKCILGFLGTKILPIIYTISLLWSVGVLIWLGLEYVRSGGNVSDLHKKLQWVIIGIIITVLAFSVVKAIEIALTVPEVAAPPEGKETPVLPTAVRDCEIETTLRQVIENKFIFMMDLKKMNADDRIAMYKDAYKENSNRQRAIEEIIYTKAIAEELKCQGKSFKAQEDWAKRIRSAVNLNNRSDPDYNKYNASVSAQQALTNYNDSIYNVDYDAD